MSGGSPMRPWSDFKALVAGIGAIDRAAVLAVGRQAQQTLSLRSWLVGTWIVQYEQDGADRAAYGTQLIARLAASLESDGIKGMSARNLANFRRVALAYPTLDPRVLGAVALAHPHDLEILQTSAKSAPALSERFYLNYLAREVAMPDENPPIGILLCVANPEPDGESP